MPEIKVSRNRGAANADEDVPAPKKPRPEITHKGTEIIGALRTEALVKSLEVDPCEDMTLIGLLILSFGARNVSIQTRGSTHATREQLVQSITSGGKLTQDAERLRVVARQMLASVLSCALGHGDSESALRFRVERRVAGLGVDPRHQGGHTRRSGAGEGEQRLHCQLQLHPRRRPTRVHQRQ